MRIDLPTCGLKTCKYCFDGSCMDKNEYSKCEFRFLKDRERYTGNFTNYERVVNIAMSGIEEFANFLNSFCSCPPHDTLEWLMTLVEE